MGPAERRKWKRREIKRQEKRHMKDHIPKIEMLER
jgi:hypothetical protein